MKGRFRSDRLHNPVPFGKRLFDPKYVLWHT